MFTGLIENIGSVESFSRRHAGSELGVSADFDRPPIPGDSIAVDGVCLTVSSYKGRVFRAFVSEETLKRSTLGAIEKGSLVNVERAMLLGDRLGGHIVQGHVDCTGKVAGLSKKGDFATLRVRFQREFGRYLVEKGSVAVNGVSLTVSGIERDIFEVALVPETLRRTNIGGLRSGKAVNLEFDILAKYIEKMTGRAYA